MDLATDVTNPIDFDERINLGLEYRFAQPGASLAYAVRGGYKVNHDTEDYSIGGGIRFKNETGKGFRIDYAFRHFDGQFFDSVNIISGGITFYPLLNATSQRAADRKICGPSSFFTPHFAFCTLHSTHVPPLSRINPLRTQIGEPRTLYSSL